ncbi:hypothetical protein OKW21_001778 [Catalinimonas alkaloidigena]|uniref:DUF4386 domain-containing protein n=1 Tax=Catalinimonas alkaloidigena TaxID=1075417 RepID=UPI0024054139|nr:DUF4386 domain-containing protein [Catalinimonas alkaloidigena]MDF9796515.1 hypothetical protein [Catalinimonas alkaloidigena]
MKNQISRPEHKNLLRLTGLLYLLVIICAGFSQGYVRGTVVVPSDAGATATNILSNEGLFRLGLLTDLLAFLLDGVISVLLYQIFKPYNKTLAMVSSTFRLLAHPAIASLNLLNHYLALEVLGGEAFLEVFTTPQLHAMSLFFMEAHQYGYLIAGAFFGVHCFLLGVLIYQADIIPNLLGGLLIGSAAGYLMETFGDFSFPGNEAWLVLVVGITAAVGEVSLSLYLLLKGKAKSYNNNVKITTS